MPVRKACLSAAPLSESVRTLAEMAAAPPRLKDSKLGVSYAHDHSRALVVADDNADDEDHAPPLPEKLLRKRSTVFGMLPAMGARAESKDDEEILWDAAMFGDLQHLTAHLNRHKETFTNAVFEGLLNARRKNGCTAVYMAAEHGKLEALQVLLQMGADPNIASHDGASPLFIASYQNNYECARVLVEAGVDPSHASASGATPLFMAAQNNSLECVELLLEAAGATVHTWPRPFGREDPATARRRI